jgi:hypothetical protein
MQLAVGLGVALASIGCGESTAPQPKGEPGTPEEPRGTIALSFVDAATGTDTPVRVEVLDSSRHSSYIAEDAIRVGGHCHDTPRRLSRVQLASGLKQEVPNAWAHASHFYADGRARIRVPPGRYHVRVFKGFEYRVATREYDVLAGSTTSDSIRIERWIDMPADGWFGSDGHLHIARSNREDDARISAWMQAEDIHVANLLQWATFRHFHNAPQYAFGEAGAYKEGPRHLLLAGQENPRTHFLGHVVVLGATSPITLPGSYLSTRAYFEAAHRYAGLAGYAHFAEAFGARNGFALDAPHDVVEVISVGRARYDTWYEALDTGHRIPPTAGSDYPCGEALPGSQRFYTQVKGPLSRDAWLDGVRRGRTFATSGPLLRFRVGGKGMGDTLQLAEPGSVVVQGEVLFDPEQDEVTKLLLVQSGVTVGVFERKQATSSIRFEIEHPIEESVWLALRAVGQKRHDVGTPGLRIGLGITVPERPHRVPAEAHSAAVVVEIAGRPALQESAMAAEVDRRWLERIDALDAELDTARVGHLELGEAAGGVPQPFIRRHRAVLRAAIDETRHVLTERIGPRIGPNRP